MSWLGDLLCKLFGIHCPPPEPPPFPPEPPEPMPNICKFPVHEIKKIIGWSHGYENLVMKWKRPHFTFDKWVEMADGMAKYVNSVRFFAYCTEDEWFVRKSYIPFPKNRKYDLRELDADYIDEITPRLQEYHDRKITTIITLFTSIKGGRYQHSPWHPNKNIHDTTDDHKKFLTDKATVALQKIYLKNMVRQFDNHYIIWELLNEPLGFKGGQLEQWYKEMINVLKQQGVPCNRIMINFVGNLGSKIFQFLDADIWSAVHGWNTLAVVKKAHSTIERWSLREDRETGNPRYMIGSGDGGAEFGVARGLKIHGGGEKNKKASSRQMRQMTKFDMSHGKVPHKWTLDSGHGIEFMSNSAFAFPYHHGYYYPNLTDAIGCGLYGLSEQECETLGVDYGENRLPECKAIYKGYKERREG